MKLKPYPEYKDSGVPWLGKISMHREGRRLKQGCSLVYGDSLPEERRPMGDRRWLTDTIFALTYE